MIALGGTTSFLMMFYLGMSIVGSGVLAYWRPILASQGIKLIVAPLLALILGGVLQMSANLRLVRWLRCRFHIEIANVIGHNESLSSPYHHEDVVALRDQTHSDFNHADMRVYRRRLRALGGCSL